MEEVGALRQALYGSLDGLEPPAFHDRVVAIVGDTSLLPGALAIRTATSIDAGADIAAAAQPAAGVQLSYEGLEMTRAILRAERWEDRAEREAYYRDLLVAEVLVSRGLYHLAATGVASDAVEIVRKFGRTQSSSDQLGGRHAEEPLEVDILELAVAAGADAVMDGVPASVGVRGNDIARELLDYPLPDPATGLAAVDDQLAMLANETQVAGTND